MGGGGGGGHRIRKGERVEKKTKGFPRGKEERADELCKT